MDRDIQDFLKYYIGQEAAELPKGKHDGTCIDRITSVTEDGDIFVSNGYMLKADQFKPILRKLGSMTEKEMKGLLLSMIPPDMEDAPDAEDYDLEMFYNDGALLVDGDVAAGANYSCRCYEGQIAIRQNGDVELFDEEGERERFINQTAAFHYLLSLGLDLFGLIDAGLAVDRDTLENNSK